MNKVTAGNLRMHIEEAFKTKERGKSRRIPSYFAVYETFLPRYKSKEDINVLEIGVARGGGLWAWKNYFENARNIVGIDCDSRCQKEANPDKNVFVCTGLQSDTDFLENVNRTYGPFDIVIDDCSHRSNDQQTAFNTLFPLLNNDSIYCIEDLHTAYWPKHNVKGTESTVSFLCNLVTELNPRSVRDKEAGKDKQTGDFNYLEKHLFSLSFFESIAVIHKLERTWLDDEPKIASRWY